MDWNFLLAKGRGRITRKPFWIATLAIYGLSIAIIFVSYYTAIHYRTLTAQEFGTIVNCLISVQFFLMCPVIIKRLHDRNRSGWWVLLVWVAPQAYLLFALQQVRALGATYTGLETAATLAVIVIACWAVIELMFRRGTPGPNRFGVNPLPFRLRAAKPVITDAPPQRPGLTFAEPYLERLQKPGRRMSALHPVIPQLAPGFAPAKWSL